MIADDSYSGGIVSISNISCDVSRYSIHDYCFPEMYRDTIFMIEIYLDMFHDTVSLSVSSRFVLRSMFLRLQARFSVSLVCVGDPDKSVFHEVLSQDSPSKVYNEEMSQLESIPCHESTHLSLLVSTSETWLSFPCYRPGWKSGILAVYARTSLVGVKVNEFADLTTIEFVSEYPEENPNIVWSGGKHLETHAYINEPLDQVKPDNCFQSSDEGPSLLFSFFLCVDLSQS